MAQLFTDWRGKEIRRHSYSAGGDFEYCNRLYRLKRKDGIVERKKSAAMEFGKAIEAAAARHCTDGHGGEARFTEEWAKHKDRTDLTYSDKDKDWATCEVMGRELMRLFSYALPALPIVAPKFQVQIEREIFPGTALAGIGFIAYLDCISSPPPNHPLLASFVGESPNTQFRPLVIDFKASGDRLAVESEKMLALDSQLATYAWISRVPDVAFLYFIKAAPRELKRGDTVRLWQEPASDFTVGDYDDGGVWLVSKEQAEALGERIHGLKNRALETQRREFCINVGQIAGREDVTRQRIQFITTRLPDEVIEETGERIKRQIAGIVQAERENFWPRQGGIRFPNQKCTYCYLRGVCAGDVKLAAELTVARDEQWLEETE